MLYKIITNTIVQQFPGWVSVNGTIYTNAAAERLALESGEWFPLSVSPTPVVGEGQYLEKNYHLVDGNIVLDWNIVTPSSNLDANIE